MGKDRELRKALGYVKGGSMIEMRIDETNRGLDCCYDRMMAIEKQLQNQPIGEVYGKLTRVRHWDIPQRYGWIKFSQKDIDDKVGNKIKINNVWYSKDDVVFHNDISAKKRKVEKKYEKE